MINSNLHPKGDIKRIIKFTDGREIHTVFKNEVLRKGREALVASLGNNFGSTYNYYINRMLFGDGGTSGGVPKFVNTERTGLFGITRASKSVITTVDSLLPTQLNVTAVLDFEDANGYVLNEMALQMNTGDLYSMSTFEDFTKTSSMQLTYIWSLSFI